MQRNILKIALIYGMALFLAAVSIQPSNAAENTAEPAIDTGTQSANPSGQNGTYSVNAQNGLRMRRAPSKDSDVITLLPYGSEVTVIGTSDSGWYEIKYADETGYVAAKYITKSDDTASGNNTAETNEDIFTTEISMDGMQASFGVTPVITALISAIIIMCLLALFTAYSFLKKEKDHNGTGNDEYDAYDDSDDDDYEYENDDNEDIRENYDNNDEFYNEGEYDDSAYYDDEEYYDDGE